MYIYIVEKTKEEKTSETRNGAGLASKFLNSHYWGEASGVRTPLSSTAEYLTEKKALPPKETENSPRALLAQRIVHRFWSQREEQPRVWNSQCCPSPEMNGRLRTANPSTTGFPNQSITQLRSPDWVKKGPGNKSARGPEPSDPRWSLISSNPVSRAARDGWWLL